MCGIAGFTHIASPAPRSRIAAAVSALRHRGPDQQGIFQSPLVSLGAARLKIQDLAHGDQPLHSADGNTTIVFNGEIYNHLELRPELERNGFRFHSHSDTETVLAAFLHWDLECFARLRGMFAVALWQESSQRLVLARDRLGIKPLYLSHQGLDLYFGSELKTLFVHPQIDRQLSSSGLDCYLALNYTPAPWTMVDGIEKFPPAHWLEWRAGRIQSEPYWQIPAPAGPRSRFTLPDAKAQLDSLLEQSVREHLLSDVPLGLWLSGGLDSSTILHYAAAQSAQPIRTYSISFQGRSFDESAYIQQVAAQYGSHHEQLDLNENEDLLGAIEQFPDYFDEPNSDGGALPVWFLSKLTKSTATVAFSGEGADELFGGYLTYRASRLAALARSLPTGLTGLARSLAHRLPVSDDKISLEYKLKRFFTGLSMDPYRAHVYWNGTFSEAEKFAITRLPLPSALRPRLNEAAQYGAGLNALLRFDQTCYLPDDILMKVDRMSMAHSVEVRPPFLDHRIVEFAASLPARFKASGSRQKIVLKELMKDKLPTAVLRRPKMGLDFPAHDWLRGPLREFLLDTISTAEAAYSDFFNFPLIHSFVNDHLSRRANLGYNLWGLLNLFLWMNRWKIACAPSVKSSLRSADQLLTSI